MSTNRITDDRNSIDGKTVIGSATIITGKVESHNDFHLEGEWKGDVKLNALFFIAKSGRFSGKAEALNLIVEGSMEGDIKVQKKVEIRNQANVVGNITCSQIAIAEGAYFQGGVKMGDGTNVSPTFFTEKRKEEPGTA